jgi:hypothetical protein
LFDVTWSEVGLNPKIARVAVKFNDPEVERRASAKSLIFLTSLEARITRLDIAQNIELSKGTV